MQRAVHGGVIFPFAATGRGDERLFDYEKREPGWWSIGIDLGDDLPAPISIDSE